MSMSVVMILIITNRAAAAYHTVYQDIGCNYINIDGFGIPTDSCILNNGIGIQYKCNYTYNQLSMQIYPNQNCNDGPIQNSNKYIDTHQILGFLCKSKYDKKTCDNSISVEYAENNSNKSYDEYYKFSLITNICLFSGNKTYFQFESKISSSSSCHNITLSIYSNTSNGNCTNKYLLNNIALPTITKCIHDHNKENEKKNEGWIAIIVSVLCYVVIMLYCIAAFDEKEDSKVYEAISQNDDVDESNDQILWVLNKEEFGYFIKSISGSHPDPEKNHCDIKTPLIRFNMHGVSWMLSIHDCYYNVNKALISLYAPQSPPASKLLCTISCVKTYSFYSLILKLSNNKRVHGVTSVQFHKSLQIFINDLKQLYNNNATITIKCQLKVLRSHFTERLSFNSSTTRIKWVINEVLLNKYKICDPNDYFQSDHKYLAIFDDLFFIAIYPNYDGTQLPYLRISMIKTCCKDDLQCIVTLRIKETSSTYKRIADFSRLRDDQFTEWSNFVLLESFANFTNALTIYLDFEIIDYYEKSNYLKKMHQLNDYTKLQKMVIVQHYVEMECNDGQKGVIPDDIIYLIALFYPKLNGNIYEWNIADSQTLINKVLSWDIVHRSVYLQSDVFTLSNIHWTIKFAPNGYDFHQNPHLTSSLFLEHFPEYLSLLVINYRATLEFTDNNGDVITLTFTEINKIKKDQLPQSKWVGTFGAHQYPILEELKSIENIKTFKICYYVNLLKVIDKSGQCIYKYMHPLQLNEQISYDLEWVIVKQYQINAIANGGRPHIYFESDIFYNMWCMRLAMDNGNFSLYLALCSLPNDIDELNITIKLKWFTDRDNGELSKQRQTIDYEKPFIRFTLPSNGSYRKFVMMIIHNDKLWD